MPTPIVFAEAGVEIAATVLTAANPAPVQVTVNGIEAGSGYTVFGTAGEFEWPVNAGVGVSVGGQIVLIDLQAPINQPIVYKVTVSGVTFEAEPVTVQVAADFVFQTLGGFVAIPFTVEDTNFEREYTPRQSTFQIPGRSRPVTRFDTLVDGTGTLRVTTTAASTQVLLEALRSGAPIMWRQNGIRDLPPVETFIVSSLKSTSPFDDLRQWDLTYTLVDNPEPGVASVAFAWADFEVVYADATWDDFNAEWSGLTWADFNRYDWGQRINA